MQELTFGSLFTGIGGSDSIAQQEAESKIRGMADGFSDPLDRSGIVLGAPMQARTKRLRALGNSVVPQVAEYIGSALQAHSTGIVLSHAGRNDFTLDK